VASLAAAPAVAVAPRRRSAASPDAAWDGLLWCVAGYILTAVGRAHQLVAPLENLHPAILTGALAILLYALDQRHGRALKRLWTPTTKWLLALVAWMMLSVPGALVAGSSFDLVFGDFLKIVAMYFVIGGAVRGERDIERLMGAYLFAAALYSGVVLARFDTAAGDDWRLGHLYTYDANDFATYAITAMPFGLYFANRGRPGTVRAAALVALALLSAAFVRSGSRGGFLALLVMGGYVAVRYTAVPVRTRALVVATVAVVLLGAASDRYWEQMGTILSDNDYNHTDEAGRLPIWGRGIGYMLQYPVLGVGPNNFGAAEGLLSPLADRQQFGVGVRWNAPHNSFVQVGAELGLPGLVMFGGMLLSAFGALRRASQSAGTRDATAQTRPELPLALTASLLGFVVGAFFLSLAYSDMLYTLLALVLGLEKLGRPSPAGIERS
jgi:O-antigen ligase